METISCPGEKKLDPRVRRTRKLLEDAFRSLLTERPYAQISVGDVTEHATVNRATFYAHYQDKQHLATTMLRGDLEAALIARLVPGTPLTEESLGNVGEAIFQFLGHSLEACPKHADEFALTFAVTLQETIQHVLAMWIEHDPDAMRAFPGATSDAVATVLSWSLYGGAIRWSTQANRPSASKAARQIVALLFR